MHTMLSPVALALSVAAVVSAQAVPARNALTCVDGVLAGLQGLVHALPAITRSAEVAADRLVAGGGLYLAGPHQGFVSEGLGRAGGIMTVKALLKPEGLRQGDVVLYGSVRAPTPEDTAFLEAALQRSALVVLFTGQAWPSRQGALDPLERAPSREPTDHAAFRPETSPLVAAMLWTFTGELVAAVTRRGKMLPMYQSVVVPEGRARNAAHLGLDWEPKTVPPVGAGLLGRTYLARLAGCLRRLKGTQIPRFAQAGQLAWAALNAGHTVWQMPVGHMPPHEPGLVPEHVTKTLPQDMTPEGLASAVKAGDVILYEGYYEPFGPWVERAHELGAKIVTVVSGTPDKPAWAMGADVCIDGCWPYGDALVQVPGYDVSILPPSGVVQSLAYWMLEEAILSTHAGRKMGTYPIFRRQLPLPRRRKIGYVPIFR